LAIAALLSGAPALADNPACAKFQEPLAYNACLARFGPPAHETRAIPEPRGEAEGRPAAVGRQRVRRGFAMGRGRGGRMRLEFNVRHRGK
jgi:hypothetical protein